MFALLISGGFAVGVAGFCEGYARVRPVLAAELELLPAMLVARGISYSAGRSAAPRSTRSASWSRSSQRA